MMERFLEHISLSSCRDKFILRGGMLVAAMVGLDARFIDVWAYNLETVLAEKLETIITQTFSLSWSWIVRQILQGEIAMKNKKIRLIIAINSSNTIRKDPFFYRCDGDLCFDYLKELEEKYSG